MDSIKIKEMLDFSKINLDSSIESQRYFYSNVDKKVANFLKNGGLNIVLISGLRGVGKTTILKTIAKKYAVLYTSGDFLKLKNISLEDVSDFLRNYNYKIIIIDEILYLPNWQDLIRIESNSNSNILYLISGSSAIQFSELGQDLFRRMDVYKLEPLSFREYLNIKYDVVIDDDLDFNIFSKYSPEELFLKLNDFKNKLPSNIVQYYNSYYLEQLPFVLQEENKSSKIKDLIDKIIYKDLPLIDNFYSKNLKDVELTIKFLTSCEKFNYNNLSKNLGVKIDFIIKIIDLLVKAKLIKIIPDVIPTRELRGNKKILFSAPSLRFSLNKINVDKVTGFSREDMFGLILSNLDITFAYNYKQNGYDYLANNIKFEIGAKKKVKSDVISVGDFLDLKLENGYLIIPFYIFALLNKF